MSNTETNIFHATTDDGALTLDATQFPILIATWKGAISVELMDRYFEFRNPLTQRADELGAKVVVITDITDMELPSSTVRKYIGERARETDPKYASMLGYVVIVPNRLLRGVVTAVRWFMGDSDNIIRSTDTLDSAFALTRKIYEEVGATSRQRGPGPGNLE